MANITENDVLSKLSLNNWKTIDRIKEEFSQEREPVIHPIRNPLAVLISFQNEVRYEEIMTPLTIFKKRGYVEIRRTGKTYEKEYRLTEEGERARNEGYVPKDRFFGS